MVSSEKVSLMSSEQKLKDPHSSIQQTFVKHLLCARLHACPAGCLSPGTECLKWEGSERPSALGPSALLDSPCPEGPAVLPHKNSNRLPWHLAFTEHSVCARCLVQAPSI